MGNPVANAPNSLTVSACLNELIIVAFTSAGTSYEILHVINNSTTNLCNVPLNILSQSGNNTNTSLTVTISSDGTTYSCVDAGGNKVTMNASNGYTVYLPAVTSPGTQYYISLAGISWGVSSQQYNFSVSFTAGGTPDSNNPYNSTNYALFNSSGAIVPLTGVVYALPNGPIPIKLVGS